MGFVYVKLFISVAEFVKYHGFGLSINVSRAYDWRVDKFLTIVRHHVLSNLLLITVYSKNNNLQVDS